MDSQKQNQQIYAMKNLFVLVQLKPETSVINKYHCLTVSPYFWSQTSTPKQYGWSQIIACRHLSQSTLALAFALWLPTLGFDPDIEQHKMPLTKQYNATECYKKTYVFLDWQADTINAVPVEGV